MQRDTYDKKWKLGPFAKKKEDLKQQGKLDKYGRIVDDTPEAWKMLFGDQEKATSVDQVAQVLGAKPKAEKSGAGPAEADDAEQEKKRDKKKKDKKDKDKKDKKEKKSKKAKKEEPKSDEDSD